MDVCRICLSTTPDKCISQLKTKKNQDSRSPLEVFMFCFGIQVTEDSNITTKLCGKCYSKTKQYYEFKLLALKSDTYLNSIQEKCNERNTVFLKNNSDLVIKIEKDEDIDGNVDVEPEIKIEDILSDEEFQFGEIISLSQIAKAEKESTDVEPLLVTKIEDDVISKKDNVDIKLEVSAKKRGRPKLSEKQKWQRFKALREQKKKEVCETCGKAVWDIKEHKQLHVPREQRRRIQCKLCDQTFTSYTSRYRHTRNVHTSGKKKCAICEKEVLDMATHMAVKHYPEQLKHACSVCGRRFKCASVLHDHTLTHTRERPFECDVCSKAFRTKIVMLSHKRQVHDKERSHLCQYCSKTFFKKGHLQIHLRSHTKEKPYKCEQCARAFVSRTSLVAHGRTHRRDRPERCSLCTMAFACKNYLRAHMLSHSKERKHACAFCDARFRRSDHRNRHEATAHRHLRTATATATDG